MDELARLRALASGMAPEVLDAILQHASCGVIVCGSDGRVTLHNAAAERLWPACITEPDPQLVQAAAKREVAGPVEIVVGVRRFVLTCAPLPTRGAVALFEDVTALREQMQGARSVHDRMAKLQAVGAALAEARFPEQVARVIATQMIGVVGAHQAVLAVPDAGELLVVESHGLQTRTAKELARFAVDADLPLARAYRTGLAVWLGTPEQRAREYARPSLEHPQAVACIPLIAHGTKLGAVAFGFPQPRAFDADERAQLEDLARNAALALERSRLAQAERTAWRRFEHLARAARRFAEAETQQDMLLEAITRELHGVFSAPALVAIGDPHEFYASRSHAPEDVEAPAVGDRERTVGRSGKSQIDGGTLCVPLRARGRIIGTVTVVRAAPFTQDDLLLAEELAQHAALAVDNAART
ncbi:MAG: GAF domain-containing protein [Deltaproteobacteria bacterium]|nr:GAF domain-containing protein [Deltaproteobacteria bacterium]